MLLLKDHIMDNIHLPQFSQGPENIGQGNLTGQKNGVPSPTPESFSTEAFLSSGTRPNCKGTA